MRRRIQTAVSFDLFPVITSDAGIAWRVLFCSHGPGFNSLADGFLEWGGQIDAW